MKFDVKNQTVRLAFVFIVVLIGSAILVYALLRSTAPAGQPAASRVAPTPSIEPSTNRPGTSEPAREPARLTDQNESLIGRLFGSTSGEPAVEGWGTMLARITLRLLLAAALGAALAFRPRQKFLGLRRNPYVAETQILLAIVAAALMMIVGDNAARAFGIFAAASLVRFRTNIRDPKEISVLLISLALGLATGVGKPELAVIFCAFSLLVLWGLERREARQVSRTMDLKIQTKDIESTQNALKAVLSKYGFVSELRAVSRDDDNHTGAIVNTVDVNPSVTTDRLSEEILTQDAGNITAIEWEPKKSFSYLYQ